MPVLGIQQKWTFTSTGRGTPVNAHAYPTWWTFYVQTSSVSTCTIDIDSRPSTSGPWACIGTRQLSTSTADMIRLEGPLLEVAPRVTDMSSTGPIVVWAVGT